MNFSKYQAAVFDWVQNGRGSKVVEAVAGSGKTTTIVHAASLIPPHFRVLFLAFNKNIAEELKTRLPAHVTARTMNSLGSGIVFKHKGACPLEADKLNRVVKDAITKHLGEDGLTLFKFPIRLIVRRMKNLGIRPEELRGELWNDIKEEVIAESEDLDRDFLADWSHEGKTFFEVCHDITCEAIKMTVEAADIDFDDQIYLPVYHGWKLKPYDFIFVDECQDLSPSNRKLLKLVSNRSTRFCFVGDSRQAIYAFRGADSRSIACIKEEFGCDSLPLSICYRCPKDVVRMAQQVAPEIEHFDGNQDGQVGTSVVAFNPSEYRKNDLLVCRLNAPLVRAAIQLAKNGKRCVILGREFGKSLSSLVRSFKAKRVEYVPAAAQRWMEKKIATFVSMGKDPESAACKEVADKYEALMFFYEELKPSHVDDFCSMIEARFSDKEDGESIVLATVHKAKGKEYDRVFIVDPGKIGAFGGRGSQEENILYVAVTRAKKELAFVNITPDTKNSPLLTGVLDGYVDAKFNADANPEQDPDYHPGCEDDDFWFGDDFDDVPNT